MLLGDFQSSFSHGSSAIGWGFLGVGKAISNITVGHFHTARDVS